MHPNDVIYYYYKKDEVIEACKKINERLRKENKELRDQKQNEITIHKVKNMGVCQFLKWKKSCLDTD